jgi:hypothetical protein
VVSQDFICHSNNLLGIVGKKGNCIKSIYVHVVIKSINNVKRLFKDGAENNYRHIGCVAATLNNRVLYKTRISCNNTVKYFVVLLISLLYLDFCSIYYIGNSKRNH